MDRILMRPLQFTMLRDLRPLSLLTAFAIIAGAVLLRMAFDPAFPTLPPFITLYPAVALAGLFCGPLSTAIATVFGTAAAVFFWIPPRFSLSLLQPTALVTVALFSLACLFILLAVYSVRTRFTAVSIARQALDLALQAGGIGTWEMDLHTRRIAASATAYALHGLPVQNTETAPDDWLIGVDPSDAAAARTALQTAVAEGGLATYSYRVSAPAGGDTWISARGRVISDGDRPRLLCALVDITAQVRMQDELARGRERLRLAMAAAALAVWDYDIGTGTVTIDAQYASTIGFGQDGETMTRDQIGAHIHPDDRARVAAEHDAAVARGGDYRIEYRAITMTGEVRWVVSQGNMLVGGRQPAGRIVGILQDVTDTKRRELELQELAALRELLIREADHRIKNSLQMVIALLTLQLRGLADPDAAEALRGAITRVGAIAASHLALQSSDDLRQVDLALILQEVCGHFAQLQPAIAISCRAAGPLMLDADRAIRLGLAVSEVLTNALRHGFRDRAEGAVTVDASIAAGELAVRIADDGIGMAAESDSSGLGSRIIRSLTAQLRASLQVESRLGAGTVVTIRLPAEAEEPAQDSAAMG